MITEPAPFVIGLLADLSGQPINPLPRLKDRRFVTVTSATLPQLFRFLQPSLKITRGGLDPILISFPDLRELSIAKTPKTAEDELDAGLLGEGLQHDSPLDQLRATWHGLNLLVSSTASCQNIKTKALNVSKKELLKDLQRAPEFDQSAIYRKVFDDQGGSFGGEPFAFLVVDYDFSTSSEDIELLQKLSIVADASATSILTYCGPAVAIKEKRTSICAPSDRFRSRRRVIAPTTVSLGHWGRAPVPERGR